MKKLILAIMITFMAVAGYSNAEAYSVEIVPGTTILANPGDLVFFDIVFHPDTVGNTFGNYGFNVMYDTAEMTWNSGSSTFTPPSPLAAPFFAPFPNESPNGTINNITGVLPFGTPAPTLNASTSLAHMAFDVVSPLGDGASDLWISTMTGTNFNVDGSLVTTAQITKTGAPDIAVAPEPVSSTLFIVGAATLGFRRFRNRKLPV